MTDPAPGNHVSPSSRAAPEWMTLRGLADALAKSELSAVEALDAHFAAVEVRNPAINCVVTVDADRARAEATEIDRRRVAGEPLGPLAGVPMTVKDSLMTAGMRTTSGAPELSDFVPEIDAAPVARLRAAGAVIFGKTNLPLYAGDTQSFNEIFGTSNNPWDLSRTVGGSSGGSAGALAAGLTPLEVGSDIAGSIRNPAGMCGVVGHKPSYGIVSAKGQIPGPPGTLTQADLAVVGPMARTVGDAALALELLAGPDDWHDAAWTLQLPPPRTIDPANLRVAVMATDPYCPVDPEIEAAILDVANQLEGLGAKVSLDARPEGFDFAKTDRTFWALLGGALSGSHSLIELDGLATQSAAGETVHGELGIDGSWLRHREWLTNNERRLQMRARWKTFFDSWDVVLAPIAPTVAYLHDHSFPMTERTVDVAGQQRPYLDIMRWMGLFGMAYLPATALPIGMHSTGLPIGLQVVGPFLHDRTALAAAAVIEELTGGTQRPPAYR